MTSMLLLGIVALLGQHPQEEPACLDHTGLNWVLPFEKAKARATAEKRLLMIKPIAFGTDAKGGW